MSFAYQNRPGVYAGYDVSGVYSGAIAGKVIAVAAHSTLPAKVYVYTCLLYTSPSPRDS